MPESASENTSDDPAKASPGINNPDELSIEYVEAQDYKVVHADGAQGSFTQGGKFFFRLYTEHASFPKKIVRRITDEGNLGEVIDVDSDADIHRRHECGIIVDLETLVELHDFLGRQLEELQELSQAQDDDQTAE